MYQYTHDIGVETGGADQAMAWPLFWPATIKQNRKCRGLSFSHSLLACAIAHVIAISSYSLSVYCRASRELSDAMVAVRPNCSSTQHSTVIHSIHKHLAWPLQFCFLRLCMMTLYMPWTSHCTWYISVWLYHCEHCEPCLEFCGMTVYGHHKEYGLHGSLVLWYSHILLLIQSTSGSFCGPASYTGRLPNKTNLSLVNRFWLAIFPLPCMHPVTYRYISI